MATTGLVTFTGAKTMVWVDLLKNGTQEEKEAFITQSLLDYMEVGATSVVVTNPKQPKGAEANTSQKANIIKVKDPTEAKNSKLAKETIEIRYNEENGE